MDRLPSVFVSHGSPMHALQPGAAGEAWKALGKRLGKPKAIVIASAHWETNLPMLTGSTKPETIHDFYNFPEPLYRLRYAAPGAPEVAHRAQGLLKAAGFTAAVDGCRGLDHGAWSPLLYMYPDADVPVVQISVQPALGTRQAVNSLLRNFVQDAVDPCGVFLRRVLFWRVRERLALAENDGIAPGHDFIHSASAILHRGSGARHSARHVL